MDNTFIAGDIGLSTDNSFLGNSIRFFQSMWTLSARYSHSFMYIGYDDCVEALGKITKSPASKYNKSNITVYRIPLSYDERTDIRKGLLDRVNSAYGWDKYPFFFMDAVTSWLKRVILRQKAPCFWFTKTFKISNIPVCSQLVVWAIYKFTSYRFKDINGQEVPWTIMTPDYLDDICMLPINNADVICEQKASK